MDNLSQHETGRHAVVHGECAAVMASMPPASVDAVVTDPPYAIRRASVAPSDALMDSEMLGMQSQNWHASETHSRGYADNDPTEFQAWCAAWLAECHRVMKPGAHLLAFGGTRTWHRLAMAAEDVGFEIRDSIAWLYTSGFPKSLDVAREVGRRDSTAAARWHGWGSGLKPAHEPVVLARKPLQGTVAENVLRHGVGALNIDGTRVGTGRHQRWTPNVCMDSDRAQQIDSTATDSISLSLWVSKPGRAERVRVGGVSHPTVKPLDLMRHLVRLVTPPDGLVLDPFAGSGTTTEACLLEGVRSISIERESAYLGLIHERIRRRTDPFGDVTADPSSPGPLQLPL